MSAKETIIACAFQDNFLRKGDICSASQKLLENFRPPLSATAVERLEANGITLVENTDEASFTLSTDTAPRKELINIKPTFGAISRFGVATQTSSLETVGCYAKTLDSLKPLMKIMAGKDPKDSTSLPENVFELTPNPIKIIGTLKDSPAPSGTIEKLKNLGYEIHEVNLPNAKFAEAVREIIASAEAIGNTACLDGVRYGTRASENSIAALYGTSRAEGLSAETKNKILLGNYIISHENYDKYFLKAARIRTLIINDLRKVFDEVDCLLGSPLPALAPLSGLPSATFSDSLTIIGRHKEDVALLDLIEKMEVK
ncbi:amidase family protein [Candidatus Saccharibacteria bacterium]|nr:amidase family protein [Candidatus Saccharibacteria bacterium]